MGRPDRPAPSDVSHPVGLDDPDTICVAIGPGDDQPIVVSGGGRTLRLWDAVSGAARTEPLKARRWGRRHSHRAEVTAVAMGNVDGTPIVVSAARDGTLRRWDARRARSCGGPMRGHDGKVTAVAVGVLGGEPTIVSGGADGTVRCWDARRGRPSGEPWRGHRGSVTAVAIGPIDGRPTVISGGADGTVRLWAADGTAVLPTVWR